MKSASVNDLKQELQLQKHAELVELCLRLSKFKKENKELLTYLLFEAQDEQGFVSAVNEETSLQFSTINYSHLYFAKKSLRKIVRMINKFCRYSGIKESALAIRIHFCSLLKQSVIPIEQNVTIKNLYFAELKKIEQLLSSLHEDLQFDYRKSVDDLYSI